jgi:hypothetical protein
MVQRPLLCQQHQLRVCISLGTIVVLGSGYYTAVFQQIGVILFNKMCAV